MNTITQSEVSMASVHTAQANNDRTAQSIRSGRETQAADSASAQKTSRYTNGMTIGTPELSEAGKKYYEQLKKKYSNMDFILVSEDMKAMAQANAGKYADPNRMVVLVDTDKIERMAVDEGYRKQYEGIISNAALQMPQIKDSLGMNSSSVKSFGMQVGENGTTSFFAVIDKSLAAQKDRIEKKAAKKAEEKKKDKKAAEKERAEERRTEKADAKKKAEKQDKAGRPEDTVTVTASSIEELIRKINDTVFAQMSDSVQTDRERQLGQNFDLSI